MTATMPPRSGVEDIFDHFADLPVYGVGAADKRVLLTEALNRLTDHHRRHNPEYDRLLRAAGIDPDSGPRSIDQLPAVTVGQFKGQPFRSIAADDVAATLRSSGTTGTPSIIHLDRPAAARQSRTLARIMRDWLGPKRLPMLIADHPMLPGATGHHTARGAGIQGMSMLGRHHTYALREDLTLDVDTVRAFAERFGDGPTLVYGFTFVVWQHFLGALAEHGLHLPNAVLVHGGGWKRLQSRAVDRQTFRERAADVGIDRVHDYYGMVEQTGAIFVECDAGHLHAPVFADVVIRDVETHVPVADGTTGLVQLCSVLPTSYPGHVLLTEDLGKVVGVDDCECGRLGRHIEVLGRLPKTEARGCSDAFADSGSTTAAAFADSGSTTTTSGGVRHLLGAAVADVQAAPPVQPGAAASVAFLHDLSARLREPTTARDHPQLGALGFWLRDSNLGQLTTQTADHRPSQRRQAAGLVLHLTPGNVDLLFAYVWALSLLSGNADIVRLSRRESDERSVLLSILSDLLDDPTHESVRRRVSIITYDHDNAITERLSASANRRVIWGSDETVGHLRSVPSSPGCRDLVFPDRRSGAIVSAAGVLATNDLGPLADRFVRDAYGFDQRACSSPSLILWVPDGDVSAAHSRFWSAVADRLDRHAVGVSGSLVMAKRVAIERLARRGSVRRVTHLDPRLDLVDVLSADAPYPSPLPGGGLFFEATPSNPADLPRWVDGLQTLVTVGLSPRDAADLLDDTGCTPPDRLVAAGQALDFDVVWDGMNVLEELSRTVRWPD